MDYLKGLLSGFIEGFCQFLPLSPAAHRMLAERFCSLQEGGMLYAYLGALAAVLFGCRKMLGAMVAELAAHLDPNQKRKYRRRKLSPSLVMGKNWLIALIPSVIAALILRFSDFASNLQDNLIAAGVGLLLCGGLVFIGAHSVCREWEAADMSGGHAFKLGLFGAIGNIVPGISPFGAVAAMGMNMGFKPIFAAEFSLLLCLSNLLISIGMELPAKELAPLPIGAVIFGGAFLFGAAAIALVKFLVKKERFGLFAYYCLAAGIAALILN